MSLSLLRGTCRLGIALFALACLWSAAPGRAANDFPSLNGLPSCEVLEGGGKEQDFGSYPICDGMKWQTVEGRWLGQEKPVADNRSEEGRAKNRRVEIVKR